MVLCIIFFQINVKVKCTMVPCLILFQINVKVKCPMVPCPGLAGISTPESLPDIVPVSPMEPKLLEEEGLVLEEEGLVLEECLLELAEGGLPLPCLNSWCELELELGLDPGIRDK